jgi:hypothetical protein
LCVVVQNHAPVTSLLKHLRHVFTLVKFLPYVIMPKYPRGQGSL